MFTIRGCSPKRGEICSCTHVPELQCTDIKTVLSLLKGLIRWQGHFPQVSFIFYDLFFMLVYNTYFS